jgi:NADPH2:quinone reductase
MRAWRVHELGEPEDVMRLEDVPDPEPGANEVLIDIAACALNFPDVLLCRGLYQEKPPLPFTPGVEVAGTVAGTQRRVIALPRSGGLAQRTTAHTQGVFPIPDTMPMTAAAALCVTYQTGHLALHRRARLQPGETLLVHAGAGGVGSAAIQLGLAAGARVIATAGGPDKVEVCRKLGAELAIDYTKDDFVDAVKEHTGGRGADVVYDPVGGDTFDRSRKCVAFEGRILVIGFTSGRFPEAPANHVLIKNYSVVGVHWGLYNRMAPNVPHEIHAELVRLYEEGKIDPLVSQVLPLDQAPQALAALGSRGTTGKIVVTTQQ